MKAYKIGILAVMMLMLQLCTSCGKNVMEETTEAEVKTSMAVNGVEIKVGMTSEEIKAIFSENGMEDIYIESSLIERKDICIYKYVTNRAEDNKVLTQNAYVDYLFDTDNNLRELFVVYDTVYDNDVIYSELKSQYGESHEITWMEFGKYIRETYRWDMEDGVSILWLREPVEGHGSSVIMIKTEDIDKELQFATPEEAPEELIRPEI